MARDAVVRGWNALLVALPLCIAGLIGVVFIAGDRQADTAGQSDWEDGVVATPVGNLPPSRDPRFNGGISKNPTLHGSERTFSNGPSSSVETGRTTRSLIL